MKSTVFKNRTTAWMLGWGMVLGAVLPGSLASAEGLPITPGLWEVKTENPVMGGEEVQQHCMQEAVFDPVSIMGDKEGCQVENQTMAGNSIDYDLACAGDKTGEAGQASGHFSFTVDGDQGSGKVDLIMKFGDQSMTMQYTMDAKRIGNC